MYYFVNFLLYFMYILCLTKQMYSTLNMYYFVIRIFLSIPLIIRHTFAKTFLVCKSLGDKAVIYLLFY